MKKQLLVILFCVGGFVSTYGQYILKNADDVQWYKGITQEKIVISSNAKLLFAGETMFYNAYCFNAKTNNFSNNSKIAYVELVGENNIVFKQKIKLNRGVGSGDFFIPTSIKSGNYKLIGYTQWMKNGAKTNFFQSDIVVLNPYASNSNIDNIGSPNENFESYAGKAMTIAKPINLKTNASIYSTRQKVSLDVNLIGNGFGNYSVAVRKKDDIVDASSAIQLDASNQNNKTISEPKAIGESIYLPEFAGEMIIGRVINKATNKGEGGKDVVLSILSNEAFQDLNKTNSYGVFYFQLKDSYSSSDALVQVLGKDRDNFKIEIKEHESIDYSTLEFKKFQLTKEHQNKIVERSIHNQVQNAYFSVKQDTIKPYAYPEPFFGNPPKVYQLDDFKRFPTIGETIVEVIDHVWDQKAEKGKRSIDVREREFDPYYGIDLAPMVLIDGAFIQDHQSVLDFDATKVKTVKVHREEYYYGKIVYQGIIRFETFDGNYAESLSGDYIKKFDMFSAQPNKKYFNQSYNNSNNVLANVPDFREQLLWHPNLTFNKKVMNFEFFTSDVTGEFEIVVKGFTNLGEPVYITESISVN